MGPYDLSLTRGRGQYAATVEDERDAKAIAHTTRKAGKLIGMPAASPEGMALACSLGANLISIGDDLGALNVGLRIGFDRLANHH
jgi:2-keto-3-deoxy-L-rhamnonate aldolase RhmA